MTLTGGMVELYLPQLNQCLNQHRGLSRNTALLSILTCIVKDGFGRLELHKSCEDENKLCLDREDGTGYCGGTYGGY